MVAKRFKVIGQMGRFIAVRDVKAVDRYKAAKTFVVKIRKEIGGSLGKSMLVRAIKVQEKSPKSDSHQYCIGTSYEVPLFLN